jgi:sulfonate transport system permease protein
MLYKTNNEPEKHSSWKIIKNVLLPFVVPVIIIVIWQYGATTGIISRAVLPAPTALVRAFFTGIRDGMIGKNLWISLLRVIKGFLIGAGLGLVLGFLMGLFETMNKMFSSIVSVLRPIPTIAIVPVVILLLGIDEISKVAVIAIGSLWPVLLNTIHGVESVDKKLLQVAYIYKLKTIKVITKIVLPSALPSIVTGTRLGVSAAWMSVVGAEMIASTKGIGYLLMYSREMTQSEIMYVCVFIIGFIGLLIDKVLIRVQKYCYKRVQGVNQ